MSQRLYTMSKKEKPKLFNKEYQKQWSETHKYKHIHTGEYCRFEANIAEYLILRREEAFKKPKPAYKFWTKGDKLYPAFMRQLKAVVKLRKTYDEATILEAIQSPHFNKIFFIGIYEKNYVGWKFNPLALEAIKRYDKEHKDFLKLREESKKEVNIEEPEPKDLKQRKKQYNSKKSSINKLRNK